MSIKLNFQPRSYFRLTSARQQFTDKSQKRLWPQHAYETGSRGDWKRREEGGIRWSVPSRDEVVTSAVERLQSSLREHRIDIDSHLVLPRANCLSSTAGGRREKGADFGRKLASDRERRGTRATWERKGVKKEAEMEQRLVMPVRDASRLKRNESRAAVEPSAIKCLEDLYVTLEIISLGICNVRSDWCVY